MSDLSIPGVTDKYNTKEMINKLMKVERIPLNRLENQKKDYAEKKLVWQDLNRTFNKFRDSAKLLYGFENPFEEHTAHSSDESVFTATASRAADNEKLEIKVKQLAEGDRFLSKSIEKDYQVPPGTYGFSVGKSKVSFRFNGGKIPRFVDVLNKRSNGLVKGKLMKDTANTQVFFLESTKTGSENKLALSGDFAKLGINTGLITSVNNSSREISLSSSTITASPNTGSQTFAISRQKLTVKPMKTVSIPFTPPIVMKDHFVFEYDVSIKDLDKKQYTPPSPPPGPSITKPGSVTFEGVTIQDAGSQVILPKWTPPPKPVFHETLQVITLNGKPLPALKDTNQVQHFSIKASDLDNTLQKLTIHNNNTSREITISNIKASDPNARGGYAAINPVSQARNAVIEMEGITITRPQNTIKDLLDGVTLDLHAASPKKLTLSIEPDRELIKNDIISFVGNYNQVMQNIQILTSNDENIINEIDYLSDDEKKSAKKHLGMFQGDYMFIQMKNRLQQIAMAPYPTSKGKVLDLLAQIGISTNSSGFGGGIDRTKLRGYLEINENQLDDTLKDDIPAVKELFGKDTNNDLIIDSGVAYSMNNYISVYTKVGGVIASRLAGIDSRVSRLDNSILTMKSDLDRKEQELKLKYGKMEGALQNLQESSKSIDNFSKRNSSN